MAENKKQLMEEDNDVLVRISGQDISGGKKLHVGLTKVKGVSWSISNLVCKKLSLNKNIKFSELEKEQIKKIEDFLKKVDSSDYLKNRSGDLESGEGSHLVGVELEMRKNFDIKRLKQIKSYKGIRHSFKLPARGQKTRGHFRKSGIAVGVRKPRMGKKS